MWHTASSGLVWAIFLGRGAEWSFLYDLAKNPVFSGQIRYEYSLKLTTMTLPTTRKEGRYTTYRAHAIQDFKALVRSSPLPRFTPRLCQVSLLAWASAKLSQASPNFPQDSKISVCSSPLSSPAHRLCQALPTWSSPAKEGDYSHWNQFWLHIRNCVLCHLTSLWGFD